MAVKRTASEPAEDRRVRARGGPANPERAAARQRQAENPRLDEDRQGNVKAKRVAKTVGAKTAKADTATKSAKSASFSPEASERPEDRYGVRRRAPPRNKSLGAPRSRERVGLVA